MSSNARPAEATAEKLIDHIASSLPDDVRAEFFRVMRRCRDLPENDEMLCILNVMKILTLLVVQVPGKVVSEREKLEKLFSNMIASQAQLQKSTSIYQKDLDARLSDLPKTVMKYINPAALSLKIEESVEQHFTRSELPQVSRALEAAATQMKSSAGGFKKTAEDLRTEYQLATTIAKQSIVEMLSDIEATARSASAAADRLAHAYESQYWWVKWALAGLTFVVGLWVGLLSAK